MHEHSVTPGPNIPIPSKTSKPTAHSPHAKWKISPIPGTLPHFAWPPRQSVHLVATLSSASRGGSRSTPRAARRSPATTCSSTTSSEHVVSAPTRSVGGSAPVGRSAFLAGCGDPGAIGVHHEDFKLTPSAAAPSGWSAVAFARSDFPVRKTVDQSESNSVGQYGSALPVGRSAGRTRRP